jgi:mannitol/fructose-specific phosphotransferase system IIA component (Ntr-type)
MKEKSLLKMLTPDRIRCNVRVDDWKEAVSVTGKAMEQAGLIESRYTAAMRELIEKEGPYLVIAPGIALLHARPDEGVLKAGFVMITLFTPVNFGHSMNDPVWLLFGLAAATDKSHVQALSELALLLSEPGSIEALRNGKNEEELMEVILEYTTSKSNK